MSQSLLMSLAALPIIAALLACLWIELYKLCGRSMARARAYGYRAWLRGLLAQGVVAGYAMLRAHGALARLLGRLLAIYLLSSVALGGARLLTGEPLLFIAGLSTILAIRHTFRLPAHSL